LDLPLQANFIEKSGCLMDISLKTSALLKQGPLFVPIYFLTTTGAYMLHGNMCLLIGASSNSYCTVYGHSDLKDPSNCII